MIDIFSDSWNILFNQFFLLDFYIDINNIHILETLWNKTKNDYYDNFIINCQSSENYLSKLTFKHYDQWITIYTKNNSFNYFYPLQAIDVLFTNKKQFLFNIVFSENFVDQKELVYLLNSSQTNKSSLLTVFSDSLFSTFNFNIYFNNNLAVHFLINYNSFDFEVLVHSLFSMWYPYGSPGLEDYILTVQTAAYTELMLAEDCVYFTKNIFLNDDNYLNDYYFINYKNPLTLFSFWNEFNTYKFLTDKILYNPFENKNTKTNLDFNSYFKNS